MKLFNYKKTPPKDELYVRDIIDKMLADENVNKSIAPLSNTIYLENVGDGTLVRISYLHNKVVFFNGDYPFKKDISNELAKSLLDKCKRKIEENMCEVDKLIREKEIDFLQKTLKKYEQF